jgi:hypothetical protein
MHPSWISACVYHRILLPDIGPPICTVKLDPFDGAKAHLSGRGIKRRSELALSEVEGVNPEQASAFMPGSRRVDNFCSYDRVTAHHGGRVLIVLELLVVF